jgi:peptidoglycan/LPS O-acetylase OafA/YrhL
LFHAGFAWIKGGYVGVDVFFVISGYLITSIIEREIRSDSFSIVKFYERRARRILPALILVILVSTPFAWAWLSPVQFKQFGQSVSAVMLFSSNFLFLKESGYFDTSSALKPLLHTWSLAVEEQFYVLFPLLLIGLRRLRLDNRAVFGAIAGIAAASFAIEMWQSRLAPSATFYLLHTRAWELGVGALVALSPDLWRRVSGLGAEALSALGLGLILLAVFVFTPATAFPAAAGFVPVLGAACVIMFARPDTIVGRLLSWRPIVGVGLVSYSAYLWHQPLFAFVRVRHYAGDLGPGAYAGLIALTMILAAASWMWVEQPFRKAGRFTRRQVFGAAATAGAALFGLGAFLHVTQGLPQRMSPAYRVFAHWIDDSSPYQLACTADRNPDKVSDPRCLYGAGDQPPVEVWSDSLGIAVASRLSEQLASFGTPVREMAFFGCHPVHGLHRAGDDVNCRKFRERAFEFLRADSNPAPVVLMARWATLFRQTPFDNREGGVESAFPDAIADVTEEGIAQRGALLRQTIEDLLAVGRKVVLVYPVPEAGWNVPSYLLSELQFGRQRREPLSTSKAVYLERIRPALEQLALLPDNPNLLRIQPSDLFCDIVAPGRCALELEGAPLYYDSDHLNSRGANMLANAIIASMTDKGWLPVGEKTASR